MHSPHGLHGHMKAENLSWDPGRLGAIREVILAGPSGFQQARISSAISSPTGWRLLFDGIRSPEEARLFSGRWICIPESEATRPPGGWIEADLVGMPVVDQTGSRRGTAEGLADLPTLSLRVALEGGAEVILPMEGPLACKVDVDQGRIEVDAEVWEAFL
ncbi:MAG TPA: hypothetical protein PKO15_13015 [Fibrobacteria bacterium]|nr:hypothetical protein [Fibrobacteria bacterium]